MQKELKTVQISVRGQLIDVPCYTIENVDIIISGRWLKEAAVRQEEWRPAAIANPELIVSKLRELRVAADYFTFAQSLSETSPVFHYEYEMDNVAAISIISYKDWLEKRISRKARQDIARAKRLGLVVKEVPFDDNLVQGISEIYNESPLRQGRPFWHYGKDLDTVRKDNSSFLERSIFIAAYSDNELIAFLKIVFTGKVARLMQILAKAKHNDKRPLNALIASAIEVCAKRGCLYFTYGKYTYAGKKDSSIVEFKHRNGFQEIVYPRYYVPLTFKGKLYMQLGLHLGYKRFIPSKLLQYFLDLRSLILSTKMKRKIPLS